MRILVWQWGRFGAGPRVAVELAEGLRAAGSAHVILSLASGAEILDDAGVWAALTVPTYRSPAGVAGRFLASPLLRGGLRQRVASFRPDIAICAMPALLDGEMAGVLRRLGVPFAVVIHDADLHPGDGVPLQMRMQRRLMRQAAALITLSSHVEARLREQLGAAAPPLLRARLPPFRFDVPEVAARAHGGPLRLLSFGRLLPYKGLDLLADALALLGGRADLEVRVVGQGPESAELARLRRLPNVTVENRWVPEGEVGPLLAWSDALVLSYREASQSGVAAAAISARRQVVATRVGGLAEQFAGEALAVMCEADAPSIAAAIARLVEASSPPATERDLQAAWRRDLAVLLLGLEKVFGTFEAPGLAFAH